VARERLRKPAADTPSPSKQQRVGKLAERGWQRQFEDPISVAPAAGVALRDASGPTMFARLGMMQALHRGEVRAFNPDRKEHHWGEDAGASTDKSYPFGG
jgi:hypothetical protein